LDRSRVPLMRQLLLALFIIGLVPRLALGDEWRNVDVTLEPEGGSAYASRLISIAYAEYVDSTGNRVKAGNLWGSHRVGPYFTHSYSNWDGVYSGYENIYANPGCYTATIEAHFLPLLSTTTSYRENNTGTVCLYAGPPPPKDPPLSHDECPSSPIIIRLSPGAYEMTGADKPVWFDIDADGVRDHLTWTAAATDQAFLWLDRNGDGRVTDGSELFGTSSPLRSGARAVNGFEALAELDQNDDGRIDARDPQWSFLKLWFDGDHDGVSTDREIRSLSASGIVSFATSYHWTGRRDGHGNRFAYQGTALVEHHGAVTPRAIYDVFFQLAN
jgi:hypothetical protein